MKKYFLLIFLLILIPVGLAGNDIKINTKVINERLMPIITINNQEVLQILDKGTFVSSFDRAEHIYSVLVEVEEKGLKLKALRTVRNKKSYYAAVAKIKVFQISNGDTVAHKLSSYKLAVKWISNIKAALNPDITNQDGAKKPLNAMDLLLGENVSSNAKELNPKNRFPLIRFIKSLGDLKLGAFLQYLIIFAVLQIGISLYILRKFQTKATLKKESFFKINKQLNAINNMLSYHSKEIKILTKELLNWEEKKQQKTKEKKEVPPPPKPEDKKKELIYKLDKEGKSAQEIAKTLKISLGETVSFLNLIKEQR
jgi:hypothetical protein